MELPLSLADQDMNEQLLFLRKEMAPIGSHDEQLCSEAPSNRIALTITILSLTQECPRGVQQAVNEARATRGRSLPPPIDAMATMPRSQRMTNDTVIPYTRAQRPQMRSPSAQPRPCIACQHSGRRAQLKRCDDT